MKVLTVGSDRKLFEEGSSVRARVIQYGTLFEELHVIVFSTKLSAKSYKLSENVWVYPTRSWSRWLYIFDAIRLGRKILARNREITGSRWVVDSQDPFECGLAAYRIAQAFKLPLHIQIHTDFLSPYFAVTSLLNRIRVSIARRILPHAAAIRVVSQRIQNSLSQIKCRSAKISVLPIFVDLEEFQNTVATFDLRQKYPQWSFIILVVARLSREKNVDSAVNILEEILKKYPKTGLVIVGEGPYRGRLLRKVNWQGLGDHVAFLGWQDNLIPTYKGAHLFLQTSLYEGFGLSLLESVASGCPSVSSDVGIAPELLNHKGHSFVCSVDDRTCFVEKISELIENNQLRQFFSSQIAPAVVVPFIQTKEAYLLRYKASIESASSL